MFHRSKHLGLISKCNLQEKMLYCVWPWMRECTAHYHFAEKKSFFFLFIRHWENAKIGGHLFAQFFSSMTVFEPIISLWQIAIKVNVPVYENNCSGVQTQIVKMTYFDNQGLISQAHIHKYQMNFLQTSYKFLINFLQISY
jgi:hypothetical protein